jgi:hypothetical protein
VTNVNPSKQSREEAAITLNSYLYSPPDVVERLTQGEAKAVQGYRKRAVQHIIDFERAFAGHVGERTKY